MPNFLLEIGCEEIPARMISAASQELRERVSALLSRERLAVSEITSFDTPRRLAVIAHEISTSQPDATEQITGPSVGIAYKDGQPTPAAFAFAKKAGVDVSQLEQLATPKGEYLSAKIPKRAEAGRRFLPKVFRRRSHPSTGLRICTGARQMSALCAQCAGWSRCWMTKRFRWNSMAFEPVILPAGIDY